MANKYDKILGEYREADSGSSSSISLTAGLNVDIDNTDPNNPVISTVIAPAFTGLTMNGTISMASNTISDLVDPLVDQDAATKVYVDTADVGLQTQINGKANLDGGNTFTGTQIYLDQTADRIAIFGSSQQLQIAPVGTYPTLTELSYVKGVTSSIQAQIDGISLIDQEPTTSVIIPTGHNAFTTSSHSVTGVLKLEIQGTSRLAIL